MGRKEYEQEMRRLHGELVALQEWVKATGAKVCIVFEGRDTAGKGGTIKRITERVSPRVFRVVALPTPTEREKSQMYVQRYIPHFPAAGEVVIFDRSWYNRAGVERVMGFCSEEQASRFLELAPAVEKAMVDSGIMLIKYWLEVSADEQTRRLESRIDDPRKVWKLSDMDLKSYSRWYDYSRARDAMFARDRHRVGAVVHRRHRRQEARPAQHHQPPAQPDPVRATEATGRHAAEAAAAGWLRGTEPAGAAHPDPVLTQCELAREKRDDRREVSMTTDSGARISVRGAAFIGIGSMVGAGIFALLGQAAVIAGSAVWLSFLLAGLVTMLLAYNVVKLGIRYPSAGRADRVPAAGLRERTAARCRLVARVRRRVRDRGRDARRLLRKLRGEPVRR